MSEPYARKGGGTAHGRTPYRQVSQDDTDGSGVRRARLATWSKLPESLNFTTEENEVWRTKHAQLQYTNRNRWWTSHNAVVFKRWVLTFIIGVLAGLVGTFITFFTRKLTDYKFEKVRRVMDSEEYRTGSSFFCYLGFNLLYVSVAILCVYIEPVSAGSGIPEVKCYLNGINVPRIVRVRTLFCKAFGVLFSVAAALPVGKEGPMIHSGSVIGASLAQGTRGLFGTLGDTRVLEFRSDPEKRDFVACGAAAGVATAFGAPIGGVLFALEEGASFWSTQLTWRAFFCGMITIYTLYVVRTSEDLWGSADSTKMFSFGEFTYKTSDGKANFSVRSRRPVVLWWFHFIHTTRVHLTSMRVVSFPILGRFGPFPVNTMLRAGLGALAVHGAGGARRPGRGVVQPFEQTIDAVAHAALRLEGATSFGSLGRLRRLFDRDVRRAVFVAAVHAEAAGAGHLDAVRKEFSGRLGAVRVPRR